MQPGVSFLDIEPAKAALALAPNLRFRCAVCGHVHRADIEAWRACGAKLARKWGLHGPSKLLGDEVLPMAFVEIANAQAVNVETPPSMRWPLPLALDPSSLKYVLEAWWARWWARAAELIREDLLRRGVSRQLVVWSQTSRRILSTHSVWGACIHLRAGKDLLYRVLCPDEVFRRGAGRLVEQFQAMLR